MATEQEQTNPKHKEFAKLLNPLKDRKLVENKAIKVKIIEILKSSCS